MTLKQEAWLTTWLVLFITTIVANHATKCGQALYYDATLILLIFLGVMAFIVMVKMCDDNGNPIRNNI